MKLKSFVLVIAALPASAASITLSPATISTSLTQCEVQNFGPCGVYPANTGYNGNLSGFTTETVGTGAFFTASGFSSPTITSDVTTSVANAIDDGELQYLIEVAGATGPVSLGVNSIGSISIDTTGPSNDAIAFSLVQLELESDESGSAVFNDYASFDYQADYDPENGSCSIYNNSIASSTIPGVATLSVSPACGGSTASGGFDETNLYTVQANSLYLVIMQADLSIGSDNGSNLNQPSNGTVEGIATVDPIFTVPNGYTLELSSGVGNSVALSPEPATWIMFATGMVLLIAGKRRFMSATSSTLSASSTRR